MGFVTNKKKKMSRRWKPSQSRPVKGQCLSTHNSGVRETRMDDDVLLILLILVIIIISILS